MLTAGIALLAGILLALQLTELPAQALIAGTLAFAIGILWVPWLRLIGVLLIGFSWAVLNALWQQQSVLPAELEGETITVVGRITGIPEHNAKRVRFLLNVETVTFADATHDLPMRVRLSWYKNRPDALVPGDRWLLTVRLKQPHGFLNPGGFDYERWLFSHRIGSTGYVYAKGENRRVDSPVAGYWVDRARFALSEKLQSAAQDVTHAGTLRALSLGDRSGIDRDQWRRLVDSGTNHLFAISGLHVGLIAALCYWLAARCWSMTSALSICFRRQRFATVIAALAALLYAAMAGFSLPTQRALVMLLIPAFALLGERRVTAGNGIGAALILVLLIDPLAPLSPGFWLSFAAVSIILFRLCGRTGREPRWRQLMGMQIALSIGLLPLLVAQFGQVPLFSVVANLVAVPWVGVVVVPLSLLGVAMSLLATEPASWLLWLADVAIETFWLFLSLVESLGLLESIPVSSSTMGIALAVIAVTVALLPRGAYTLTLAALMAVPLLLGNSSASRDPGDLSVRVLDVGQGLAVIVTTAEHTLIYDTGHRFSASFDAGAAVVVPALQSLGVTAVDMLVVSHTDLDHRGGLESLLDVVPVRQILTSDPARIGHNAKQCERGNRWRWSDVEFEILSPAAADEFDDVNNRSCVLRISSGQGSVLLPGDIEAEAERALLNSGQDLSTDLLIAPHHGSATSSTPAFIDRLAPNHVVYAVGYRNRFGFPNAGVAQRYRERGVTQWRTDRDGAVVFKWITGERRWRAYSYRNRAKRFWHHKADRLAFTAVTE